MQYAMLIDLNRCIGCHSCAVACRAIWQVPVPHQRSWVHRLGPAETPFGLASTYYPGHCNQCDKPACIPVCPVTPVPKEFRHQGTGLAKTIQVSATWKNPFNGIVEIDKSRCIGCGACVKGCPYNARFVNDAKKPLKADKCDFCQGRLDQGLEPFCVETCIGSARIFGDITDPQSAISQYIKDGAIKLESPDVRIGPNVLYSGNKRDIYLLTETSTPSLLPQVSQRRIILGELVKPSSQRLNKAVSSENRKLS
ncbi:MAG: 4Fe-4S dicluster domain-containing protein [Proteobacteria bacterium]|nr:4Fe-4S dicluster domain-containing protein [Pseudomonadota bacterium]MBU1710447.1 4Fe-4S dicluster domain-containing protein [Pseudomonadota bacterium]